MSKARSTWAVIRLSLAARIGQTVMLRWSGACTFWRILGRLLGINRSMPYYRPGIKKPPGFNLGAIVARVNYMAMRAACWVSLILRTALLTVCWLAPTARAAVTCFAPSISTKYAPCLALLSRRPAKSASALNCDLVIVYPPLVRPSALPLYGH